MKSIEIIVSPTGTSTVQTKGFAGSACQQASRFVEDALGTRIQERLTDEFYQAVPSEQQNVERH
jgi:hypothetical protein